MDAETIRHWVVTAGAIFGLISAGVSVFVLRMRTEFVTRAEHDTTAAKATAATGEISALARAVAAQDAAMGKVVLAMEALQAKAAGQAAEIAAMATVVSGLPSAQGLHELALSIERLRGDLKAAEAARNAQTDYFRSIDEMLQRHDDILSEAARRRMQGVS